MKSTIGAILCTLPVSLLVAETTENAGAVEVVSGKINEIALHQGTAVVTRAVEIPAGKTGLYADEELGWNASRKRLPSPP